MYTFAILLSMSASAHEAPLLTFDEYQTRAHSTSFVDSLPNPTVELRERASSEVQEVFMEGGDMGRFFYLYGFTHPSPEIITEISKEMGDNLWFISEYATRAQESLASIASQAASRHSGRPRSVETFEWFDYYAHVFGRNYSVFNHKIAATLRGKVDENSMDFKRLTVVQLRDNPGYVLQRVMSRLHRRIMPNYDLGVNGPPGNADFDDPELIENSPGDALWLFSAIGSSLLNTSLAEIAEGNLAKLQRRADLGVLVEGADIDRSDQV